MTTEMKIEMGSKPPMDVLLDLLCTGYVSAVTLSLTIPLEGNSYSQPIAAPVPSPSPPPQPQFVTQATLPLDRQDAGGFTRTPLPPRAEVVRGTTMGKKVASASPLRLDPHTGTTAVARYIAKHPISGRHGRLTEDMVRQVRTMHQRGYKSPAIAEQLGIGTGTVSRVITGAAYATVTDKEK